MFCVILRENYLAIMRIKQRLEHYRQWQREPFSYTRDSATHKCNNCGEEFQGNYCPTCSQRARLGRITWKSVWLGFMELWGMHTRSMPYSLLQLLLRPGYFIGDYITGRRQVSFPPMKMLVIMGLLVLIVNNLADHEAATQHAVQMTVDDDFEGRLKLLVENATTWLGQHKDWGALMMLSLLIWPTWSLFRLSPRCDHHTLPEGFFIQVFNSVQLLLLVLAHNSIAAILPSIRNGIGSGIYLTIIVVQLYRTYKQLFGHSHWGTVWRMVVAVTVAFLLMFAVFLSAVCFLVYLLHDSPQGYEYLLAGLLFPLPQLAVILLLLAVSNACIKHQLKKEAKNREKQDEQHQVANQESETSQ